MSDAHWQPAANPPPIPPVKTGKPWLPAAIIGVSILLAGGLVAGALFLKGKHSSTCQAWQDTQQTLRSIPALPEGWTWSTPDIDAAIANQNAPVAKALDDFEPKISDEPANAAQAARDYVAARRKQMQSLTDHTYTVEDGQAVDATLIRLDTVCGVKR